MKLLLHNIKLMVGFALDFILIKDQAIYLKIHNLPILVMELDFVQTVYLRIKKLQTMNLVEIILLNKTKANNNH